MDDPERRRAWLDGIAARVPRLFGKIAQSNVEAGYVLGEKRIDDRRVQLTLLARVVVGAARQTFQSSAVHFLSTGTSCRSWAIPRGTSVASGPACGFGARLARVTIRTPAEHGIGSCRGLTLRAGRRLDEPILIRSKVMT